MCACRTELRTPLDEQYLMQDFGRQRGIQIYSRWKSEIATGRQLHTEPYIGSGGTNRYALAAIRTLTPDQDLLST